MVGIGEKLRQLRFELRLKQGKFADRIEMSQGMLSDIEHGNRPLTDRNIKLICLEFGVNREWLVNGQGEIFARRPQTPSRAVIDSLPEDIPPDAAELLSLYDRLEGPEARKEIRDYARDKLELQELRKNTGEEKGERRADTARKPI
jgi:transcriptional regulator with XRE-family HTH domain